VPQRQQHNRLVPFEFEGGPFSIQMGCNHIPNQSLSLTTHLQAQDDASWMQSISETEPKRACGWQRDFPGTIRAAFNSWT
jgi:hypothetical protein